MTGRINRRRNTTNKYQRIPISFFPISKPDFRRLDGNKDEIIKNWLKAWIKRNLENNRIQPNFLLPVKAELAYYFGAGIGTVQNAIRQLEDEGLLMSKQRIGTLIADTTEEQKMNKLTSKRDKIAEQIKWFIVENEMETGAKLPTALELSEILNSKRNTVRAALELLGSNGYIKGTTGEENQKIWTVSKKINAKEILVQPDEIIETETLAQKISESIATHISTHGKIGDRLEPIADWAKRFNVSTKTAYDAMQILIDKGVLQTRRGRYGTIIVKMPQDNAFQPPKETTIFMPAAEAAVYSYKRIENLIRTRLRENYSIGQKFPSMKELSEELDVSTNTIRKAVHALANEGYVELSRGRFGGIYVLDIPEDEPKSFRWLAVNPQYVKSYTH